MADVSPSATPGERLAWIRAEIRFELGLLHDRVNALVGAEAFLTIAYTAAMSNGTSWGSRFAQIVAPVLSVLGFLLAVLAWPGIEATVRIVLGWTEQRLELLQEHPQLDPSHGGPRPWADDRRSDPDQWRSMLFFRAAPVLFAVVWTALTVVALVLPG